MTYTLTHENGVLRDTDGAFIPADPANADWRSYQAWLAAGNTPNPAPAVIPPPVRLTFLQFLALFTQAEQTALIGSADPQMKLFILEAAGTGDITLDDPRVKAGLDYAVSLGFITAAREARILAGQTPS